MAVSPPLRLCPSASASPTPSVPPPRSLSPSVWSLSRPSLQPTPSLSLSLALALFFPTPSSTMLPICPSSLGLARARARTACSVFAPFTLRVAAFDEALPPADATRSRPSARRTGALRCSFSRRPSVRPTAMRPRFGRRASRLVAHLPRAPPVPRPRPQRAWPRARY